MAWHRRVMSVPAIAVTVSLAWLKDGKAGKRLTDYFYCTLVENFERKFFNKTMFF